MEKTCSRCTATFDCHSEMRGCWCQDHLLSAEALAHLRQRYDNCLCPACLEVFEGEAGKRAGTAAGGISPS